jgi:hypothetical protein
MESNSTRIRRLLAIIPAAFRKVARWYGSCNNGGTPKRFDRLYGIWQGPGGLVLAGLPSFGLAFTRNSGESSKCAPKPVDGVCMPEPGFRTCARLARPTPRQKLAMTLAGIRLLHATGLTGPAGGPQIPHFRIRPVRPATAPTSTAQYKCRSIRPLHGHAVDHAAVDRTYAVDYTDTAGLRGTATPQPSGTHRQGG